MKGTRGCWPQRAHGGACVRDDATVAPPGGHGEVARRVLLREEGAALVLLRSATTAPRGQRTRTAAPAARRRRGGHLATHSKQRLRPAVVELGARAAAGADLSSARPPCATSPSPSSSASPAEACTAQRWAFALRSPSGLAGGPPRTSRTHSRRGGRWLRGRRRRHRRPAGASLQLHRSAAAAAVDGPPARRWAGLLIAGRRAGRTRRARAATMRADVPGGVAVEVAHDVDDLADALRLRELDCGDAFCFRSISARSVGLPKVDPSGRYPLSSIFPVGVG